MNTKKLLLATVISFVVMFAIGGVTHMVIIGNWMKAHAGAAGDISRKEPMMLYIAIGVLILAFIMSYIYPKGVESDNTVMEGLKFGLIIGILWTLPYSLILYGSTGIFSLLNIAVSTVANLVSQAAGGVAIAMVYGKKAKA